MSLQHQHVNNIWSLKIDISKTSFGQSTFQNTVLTHIQCLLHCMRAITVSLRVFSMLFVHAKDATSEQPFTTQSMTVIMDIVNKDQTRSMLRLHYAMLFVNVFLKVKIIFLPAGVACKAHYFCIYIWARGTWPK